MEGKKKVRNIKFFLSLVIHGKVKRKRIGNSFFFVWLSIEK